jgi:hypothetical protein
LEAGLFRRLAKGIPRKCHVQAEQVKQHHDPEGFVAYSDAEIASISVFPHEAGQTMDLVLPDGEEDEEKDAASDDDCDD